MRKLIVALGMTTAVCLTSAAVAFADGAPPPVQAAMQSATTSQASSCGVERRAVTADERQHLDPDHQPGQRRQTCRRSNGVDSSANAGNPRRRRSRRPVPAGQRRAVRDSVCGHGAAAPRRCPRRSSTAPRTEHPRPHPEPRRRWLGVAVEHRRLHGQRRERRGDAAGSTQSQGSSCGCSGRRAGVQSGDQPAGTPGRSSRPRRPSRSIPRTQNISVRITALGTMETSPSPTR